MALKLSILLEAVDRLTGPISRMRAGVTALAASAGRLSRATGADRLAASLGRVTTSARQAAAAVAAVAAPLGALAAAGGAVALVTGVQGAAAMERYSITLRQVEGSAEAARRALDWVSDFATRTPFELAEVTRAYVDLRNLGLDPTRGSLAAAGDAAAIMGTRFDEAVQAMSAAMRGEMDPIERFGIFARTEGENIVLNWEHQGQRMRAVVDKNNREMLARMIQAAWAQKFGTGMEQLAQSWTGMMSNLADAWSRFQLMVMNAGVFAFLQGRLAQLLATIDRLQSDGTLQRWANSISAELVRVATVIEDFLLGRRLLLNGAEEGAGGELSMQRQGGALRALGQAWQVLATVFETVRGIIAPLTGDFGAFEAAMALLALKISAPFIAAIWSLAAAFTGLGVALLTTPIGWAILAIGTLAALGALIRQNWDGIADWFAGQFATIVEWVTAAASAIERLLALIPRLPQREGGTLVGPGAAEQRRLNRRQAIQNLPGLTPEQRQQLEREAQEDEARRGRPPAAQQPPPLGRLGDLPALEGPNGLLNRMSAPAEQTVDVGGTLRIRIEDDRVRAEGRLNDPRARLDVDQGVLLGTI